MAIPQCNTRRRKPQPCSFSLVQLVIQAQEFVVDMNLRLMPVRALGVFTRLLPYAVDDPLPQNVVQLSRLAGVTVRVLRSAWPHIEPLFVAHDGKWHLRSQPWLTLQIQARERIDLRHHVDRLAEFWGRCCAYCGDYGTSLEVEHIVPLSRGGSNDLKNLTLACASCNSKKRTLTAAEFGFPHIHDMAARIQ